MTARNIGPDWHTEGQNAIPMLANLELFAPQGAGPNSFHLGAILRCGEATEASDDARFQFQVRLRRGYLAINYQDCSPVAGSHQHDHSASERGSIQRETSREFGSAGASIKVEGTADLGPVNLKATLQRPIGRVNPQPTTTAKRQQTTQHVDIHSVRYRGREKGNDIWEIGDGNAADFLNWRYLGDDHLCVVTFSNTENLSVVGSFYFYAADMDIVNLWIDGRPIYQTDIPKNMDKILKIIVQRAFDKNNGKIVVCGQRLWRADNVS